MTQKNFITGHKFKSKKVLLSVKFTTLYNPYFEQTNQIFSLIFTDANQLSVPISYESLSMHPSTVKIA